MGAALPFTLIPRRGDVELIQTLRLLLAQAEAGDIIGLAYITIQPGYEYCGDLVGYALQHPVMSLGLLKALEGQVVRIIR